MTFAYQQAKTQSGLFFAQAERFGDDTFMRAKFQNGRPCDTWTDISWKKAAEQARWLGAGLIEKGIDKNDRIGIFSHNRPRWVIADQAIQGAGAVGVPIYPTSTDHQLAFILNDCEAKALIAGDRELLEQALRVMPEVSSLEFIVCLSPLANASDKRVIDFDALIKQGSQSASAMDQFADRTKQLKGKDTAAIIYTSGTTGNPKGVVLSQANFKAQTDVLISTPLPPKTSGKRHSPGKPVFSAPLPCFGSNRGLLFSGSAGLKDQFCRKHQDYPERPVRRSAQYPFLHSPAL